MKKNLPISDKTRRRLVYLFFVVYFILFIPMIFLNESFYKSGSLAPDPATGRTYLVHEHGTLYVLPWQGELANWLFWSAAACFVLGLLVNPDRGHIFPPQDYPNENAKDRAGDDGAGKML